MFRYASRIEKAWQNHDCVIFIAPFSLIDRMKRDDLMKTDKKTSHWNRFGNSFIHVFFFNLKSDWLVRCVILMTLGTI